MRKENSPSSRSINAVSLKRIPVANKSLAQGGELKYLTPAEFQQQFGCEYSESVIFDAELLAKMSDQWDKESKEQIAGPYRQNLIKQVQQRLQNPLKDIAIYYIDKQVGYSLQATSDIEAGEVLFLYAGEAIYKEKNQWPSCGI